MDSTAWSFCFVHGHVTVVTLTATSWTCLPSEGCPASCDHGVPPVSPPALGFICIARKGYLALSPEILPPKVESSWAVRLSTREINRQNIKLPSGFSFNWYRTYKHVCRQLKYPYWEKTTKVSTQTPNRGCIHIRFCHRDQSTLTLVVTPAISFYT